MSFGRFVICHSICLALVVNITLAEDWPQFRGPHRDGTWDERGALEKFAKGGLKIEWKRAVGGGFSSPVVAGGRVFVLDVELVKPVSRERLHCFDEKTGKVLWEFVYEEPYGDWAYVPERGAGPTATPIVEGDRIYTVGANGWVHCLDCRNGKLIWEKRIGKEYEVAELQARPSPLIEGSLLIVVTGAKPGASVMALDKLSGKEVWKGMDDSVSNSSPIVIPNAPPAKAGTTNLRRELIVWSNNSLASLDPLSGKVYWRELMNTSGNDSAATPMFQNGKLLVSGLMVDVSADPPEPKFLWPEIRTPSKRVLSNTSTPVMEGDYIYTARGLGDLVCLDTKTGRDIWSTNGITAAKNGAMIDITVIVGKPPKGGTTSEKAAQSDSSRTTKVFLFTDEGNLVWAELSPGGYREFGRAHLIDPTWPFAERKFVYGPPAFADGRVIARSEREVVCALLHKQ